MYQNFVRDKRGPVPPVQDNFPKQKPFKFLKKGIVYVYKFLHYLIAHIFYFPLSLNALFMWHTPKNPKQKQFDTNEIKSIPHTLFSLQRSYFYLKGFDLALNNAL